MAAVESLGLHSPVALPYLINEGILPKDPKRELYQWETYVFRHGDLDIEEEVLATKDCVVWSQGKFIRNVYRFTLDGEVVIQAILTNFPNTAPVTAATVSQANGVANGSERAELVTSNDRKDAFAGLGESADVRTDVEPSRSRALAVFLRSKVHIYFLHGASHIIDIPFEIERAVPTLRGCIVQRKRITSPTLPPTPQIPPGPHTSFFSSQLQPTSSYLQSPTVARSFVQTQPARPSPLSGNGRANAILEGLLDTPGRSNDNEVASLYSLTDPLSDFGVVTLSLPHQKLRLSSRAQKAVNVDFETLDPGEQIVYATSAKELFDEEWINTVPLMLIVTANNDLHTITVWHAWYVGERSLRDLLKRRAAQKAAKARRRSSFLSASIGTGATTPAARHREHTRESLPGGGPLRPPGEPGILPHAATASRKPTRQEEEAAMASQMDPDYRHAGSQQPARESRRISSLNADVRASQSAANASFGAAARRNGSFGIPNERRSFGRRKSRASTNGNILSRSLGPDDDSMDIDSTEGLDSKEDVDDVLRHIRATIEAAGADNVFGSGEEGYKRELVLRKLHISTVPKLRPTSSVDAKSFRIVTLRNARGLTDGDDERLNLYIHDKNTKDSQCLKLLVKHPILWPGPDGDTRIAVPLVVAESSIGISDSIGRVDDGDVAGVLLGRGGIVLSANNDCICPLPQPVAYRAYHPHEIRFPQSQDQDVGKNRTLPFTDAPVVLEHPGTNGSYDEISNDGLYHRRRISLRPADDYVNSLLKACETVMPSPQGDIMRTVWCRAHAWLSQRSEVICNTVSSLDFIALAATVFCSAIGLLDAKAKAALTVARLAAVKQAASSGASLRSHKKHRESRLFSKASWSWTVKQQALPTSPDPHASGKKDQLISIAASLAIDLYASFPTVGNAAVNAIKLMQCLHLCREEQRLGSLSGSGDLALQVGAVIAQLGSWLGMDAWSYSPGTFYNLGGVGEQHFMFVRSTVGTSRQRSVDEPVGVFSWFEHAVQNGSPESYPSLAVMAAVDAANPSTKEFQARAEALTPKITALSAMLVATLGLTTSPAATVECLAKHEHFVEMLEILPEAIAAPFKEAMGRCEREPPTSWSPTLMRLVGRDDLEHGSRRHEHTSRLASHSSSGARDIQAVCHGLDHHTHAAKTREAGRHAVSQLIFSEDRRLVEATSLMHFNSVQTAECPKQPDWTDQHHLEQQRRVMQWVMIRMIALPAGDGMIHFESQTPLLTEKFHLPGFNSTCLMQPMGHALTIDRSGLTEEKVNWAYFHAGASAGLRLSRHVKGIDTSWIAFNKPNELTNRHAGLLLALGLGGHLRSLAKWLSFKYLTPKHSMTSIGLLLGLSASYIGSMDSLITRMLSVHITRMLPPGAAELNVSSTTQTAGLMGIGLLYYNTQHRRMTEIMLSEIEYMEVEDPDSGPDQLRDESYRLAAGFALGLINLGKGKHLGGLHGMYLPERLLAIAVGSRPIHAVHVFDRATAGAIIAVALIYLKSGDKAVARKIAIPDTQTQFDHVRPDMLMLRAMANHIILWDEIVVQQSDRRTDEPTWISSNLPRCYQNRLTAIKQSGGKPGLNTSDVPFYNIITGLAWALSMRYAGSGNLGARDEILAVLDCFHIMRGGGDVFYYDAKLARSTIRRCIDVLALSAATVMAGTGDLKTFRYLRRLHGRADPETTYGSHLASHLAIGVLFLGGGTYTLGTSDLAIASVMCAFYPLFPTDVHDNQVHLQAFRHLWVFAAEARCLVVEDSDTGRPISMPITVSIKDGSTRSMVAPCLLPDLDTIATVHTEDPTYWLVTLDFAGNASHLAAFRQNQRIYVRRCPAHEAHNSIFSATLAATNSAQSSESTAQLWQSIFNLPSLRELDKADVELILPSDPHSSTHTDQRNTVVDDRLALSKAASSNDINDLWNLRTLFAWAEKGTSEDDRKSRWIRDEVVEALRASIEARARASGATGQ